MLTKGIEPLEGALSAATDGRCSWGRFAWLAIVFTVCLGVGLVSLVHYEGSILKRSAQCPPRRPDVGTMKNIDSSPAGERSPTRTLAVVLVVGFGLHNVTEGFGIIAPMESEGIRPSWAFLGTMGLIGGGLTLLGTLIGQSFVNDVVLIGFLALAAGSILYVIVQLVMLAARQGDREILMWGLFIGLVAGFATDMVLTATGA